MEIIYIFLGCAEDIFISTLHVLYFESSLYEHALMCYFHIVLCNN